MKKLIKHLLAGEALDIGHHQIYAWSDRSGFTIRDKRNGLMGPEHSPTKAGLMRILAWLDSQ